MENVKNLSHNQLKLVRTLYQTKNIPEDILERLQKEQAKLFEEPSIEDFLKRIEGFEDIDLSGLDLERLEKGFIIDENTNIGDISDEDLMALDESSDEE